MFEAYMYYSFIHTTHEFPFIWNAKKGEWRCLKKKHSIPFWMKCIEALLPACLQLQVISLVPQNEDRKNVTHEMMSNLTHEQLRTQIQSSPETIQTTEA